MYSLNLDYVAEARSRLARLTEELRAASTLSPGGGIEEIARTQELRARKATEVRQAERGLAEALRSLGDDRAGHELPRSGAA
jgi:hypothetical protein